MIGTGRTSRISHFLLDSVLFDHVIASGYCSVADGLVRSVCFVPASRDSDRFSRSQCCGL